LRQIYGVRQADGQVHFTARFEGARQVMLAGEFNNWSAQALECDAQGTWQLQLPMQAGRYRYRYVVDGAWINDPHNYCTEPNEFGEENNVVEVVPALAIAA
jgi:1,4-alpha-glucan branching enzyme